MVQATGLSHSASLSQNLKLALVVPTFCCLLGLKRGKSGSWNGRCSGGWPPLPDPGQGGLVYRQRNEEDGKKQVVEWLSGIWRFISIFSWSLQDLTILLALVVVQSLSLCDPVDCSTPGFPVLHHLLKLAQTHVHWVGDAIQPSHPLSSPSPPAFNLPQHQDLFQWVVSWHQVAKELELQLQNQSF